MTEAEVKKNSINLREKKSFCLKAFSGLSITPSGACAPCCLFERMIRKPTGEQFKIWEDDVAEIYNSPFMKDIRRKMMAGEAIEACKQCYQVESHGGYSLRSESNLHINPHLDYDPELDYQPEFLDLKLNNKCNLKCRMCQPRDSHLIYNEFKKLGEKDSSFSYYTNTNLTDPDLGISLDEVPDWSASFKQTFLNMLPRLKKIGIVGGEPLLLDEVYELLDICIRENFAKNITLIFTTNLMHLPFERLAPQLVKFNKVIFNISLDAVGKELHYIRYPSKFERIFENFERLYSLRDNGNMHFQFTPTVQVYNVLYVDAVYKFVEKLLKMGFVLTQAPVHLTFLEFPVHLNVRILPDNVRQTAIAKLKYIVQNMPLVMSYHAVKANLQQLISILETEKITHHNYLPEFLHYSQVLDKERGHAGADYLPELFSLLAGFEASPPAESYHHVRERGWKLSREGRLEEAIKEFEKAILTSHNKEIDYREMAWMKVVLGLDSEALPLYEEAYKLAPRDQYVLKGLALQYNLTKNYEGLKNILPAALKENPGDEDLLLLQNSLRKIDNGI